MSLNKNFLTEVIKYLISKGVTVHDVLDAFHDEFEYHEQAIRKPNEVTWLDLKQPSVEESSTPCTAVDSLKNMPTEIKRGTINNVIEEPVLPKYTMTESGKISLESVSLSPETLNKVFDTSKENPLPCRKLKSKSGQMLFDVINGKTVIEHLKENGITYTNFDNRIRKKWSVEQACTTPLAPKGKGKRKRFVKEPKEHKAVNIPDTNIICLEPEKITGTKVKVVEESSTPEKATETLETESNTEKATENVTNATELKGDNFTTVMFDTPNPDAIRKDNDDIIEKALKKFVTHSDESKKDKKPKETKADLTVLEVCQKMNVTTHELKEMIATGDFPQPDCDKKWSAKLLKNKGII